MSEVLRGWRPRAQEDSVFSSDVESAAASTIAGHLAPPTADIFPLIRDTSIPCTSARRNVSVRDLQSWLQMSTDILFIIGWGMLVEVLVTLTAGSLFAGVMANFWNSVAIAAIALVVERALNHANAFSITTRLMRLRGALKVWTFAFAGLLFCDFVLKTSADLSRAYLAVYYLSGLVAFGVWRAQIAPAIARAQQKFRSAGSDFVVVGDAARSGVRQFTDELGSSDNGAFLIPLNVAVGEHEWALEQKRVMSEACRAVHGAKNAAIYLCSAGLTLPRLEALCRGLSILPVGTYIVPDAATAGLVRCRAFAVGNRMAFELRRPPMSRMQLLTKRLVDIVLGSAGLVFLAPVMIAAAIAIRLDSKGPVLFRQMRTGKGGLAFRIFKFRTMYVMEDGPDIQQVSRNDPRVTRVGRFLRATSVDELPQLFNVLKGEMSLVGPRPHAVAHDRRYAKEIPNYELRQHVKPGITGWAQVNGLRGETANVETMNMRIEFDIWYALNPSLLLDLEIMVRTVLEVCSRRNAY
jgi:Undecaprenyl-phosphate glucose phosphotransferase